MKLVDLLSSVTQQLRAAECAFALGGGLVANLYRREIRATNDVDLLLLADGKELAIAEQVLAALGLTGTTATKGDLSRLPGMGKKEKWIVVGERRGRNPTVDFLLPALPWFSKGLERAQSNIKNVPPGEQIPCLTAEDVIISKAFALHVWGERKSDVQDIEQILQNPDVELDIDYLAGVVRELGIVLPKRLRSVLPSALKGLTRAR